MSPITADQVKIITETFRAQISKACNDYRASIGPMVLGQKNHTEYKLLLKMQCAFNQNMDNLDRKFREVQVNTNAQSVMDKILTLPVALCSAELGDESSPADQDKVDIIVAQIAIVQSALEVGRVRLAQRYPKLFVKGEESVHFDL